MNAAFQFTPRATEDLDAIWWFIALVVYGEDSRDAANRVETEILATCRHHASRGALLDPLEISY